MPFNNSNNNSSIFNDLVNKEVSNCKLKITNLLSDRSTFPMAESRLDLRAKKGFGLTNVAGVYVLYSKPTKKVYIGTSTNLSQRKGEHSKDIKSQVKGVPLILSDVTTLQLTVSDFEFLPIAQLDENLIAKIENSSDSSITNKVQNFYLKVEEKLLEELFADPSILPRLYNSKTSSAFTVGNPGGSHGKGGIPKEPLAFLDYAWESKNKASSCVGRDRKTISNYLTDKKPGWRAISVEELENWDPNKKNVKLPEEYSL